MVVSGLSLTFVWVRKHHSGGHKVITRNTEYQVFYLLHLTISSINMVIRRFVVSSKEQQNNNVRSA